MVLQSDLVVDDPHQTQYMLHKNMSTSASPSYNKPRISNQIPRSTIVMPGLKSIARLTYISYQIRTV